MVNIHRNGDILIYIRRSVAIPVKLTYTAVFERDGWKTKALKYMYKAAIKQMKAE